MGQGEGKQWAAVEPQGETVPLDQLRVERLASERPSWFARARVQLSLVGLFLLVFLSAVLIWPIAYAVRRLRGKSEQPSPQRARLLGGILSGLNLLILVGWMLLLGRHLSLFVSYRLVGPGLLSPVLMGLAVLSFGLAIRVAWSAIASWRKSAWGVPARVHYSSVALTGILFLPFLALWRLLPF